MESNHHGNIFSPPLSLSLSSRTCVVNGEQARNTGRETCAQPPAITIIPVGLRPNPTALIIVLCRPAAQALERSSTRACISPAPMCSHCIIEEYILSKMFHTLPDRTRQMPSTFHRVSQARAVKKCQWSSVQPRGEKSSRLSPETVLEDDKSSILTHKKIRPFC